VAAQAQARTAASPAPARRGSPAPRRSPAPHRSSPAAPARSPRKRQSRALQVQLTRLLVAFVIAVAVLGIGRVALSFAVVQKTMATEAVAAEQRRVVAENAQLAADVTRLSSMTRVRAIALRRLDLVPPSGVVYLTVDPVAAVAAEGER
jgi:cell division protein FtsL